MAELSLSHCKYECKYHVVFAPKFRRQVIYGKIKTEIGQILRKLCEYKGIEILEANSILYTSLQALAALTTAAVSLGRKYQFLTA